MDEKTKRINQNIGRKLKELRMIKGLILADVAKAVGTSLPMITQYEDGTKGISASKLGLLASFYNVDAAYFYESVLHESLPIASNAHLSLSRKLGKIQDERALAVINKVCDFAISKKH
jgi:transcriptional regulator with XRE-family HTH domain